MTDNFHPAGPGNWNPHRGGRGPGDVIRAVVRDALVLVAIGLVIGAPAALALSRYLQSLLFGLKPMDGWSLFLVVAAMLAMALVASAIPAGRAARIDPVLALRASPRERGAEPTAGASQACFPVAAGPQDARFVGDESPKKDDLQAAPEQEAWKGRRSRSRSWSRHGGVSWYSLIYRSKIGAILPRHLLLL